MSEKYRSVWEKIDDYQRAGKSMVEARAAEGDPEAQLTMRLRKQTRIAEEACRRGIEYDAAAGVVRALQAHGRGRS